MLEPLHAADLADLIETLTKDERQLAVEILGPPWMPRPSPTWILRSARR